MAGGRLSCMLATFEKYSGADASMLIVLATETSPCLKKEQRHLMPGWEQA